MESLAVKTTLNGETTASEIPVPADTVSEYTGVASLLTQKGLKTGDKQTFHMFVFDLLKPVKTEIEVLGEETLNLSVRRKAGLRSEADNGHDEWYHRKTMD